MTRTALRVCTLCEANCGLRFEVEGERIVRVRPDADDPFSQGYVCPKGIAIAQVPTIPTGCASRCGAPRPATSSRSAGTRRWPSPPRACAGCATPAGATPRAAVHRVGGAGRAHRRTARRGVERFDLREGLVLAARTYFDSSCPAFGRRSDTD